MSIPSPPAKVIVSVARAIESVPVSPAIPREVVIEAVETAVTKPFALTVRTGIAVVEPNCPTLEFTVSKVTLIVVSPRLVIVAEPSTSPEMVITGSFTLKSSLPLVSSYVTEIPDSVLLEIISPTRSCTYSVFKETVEVLPPSEFVISIPEPPVTAPPTVS